MSAHIRRAFASLLVLGLAVMASPALRPDRQVKGKVVDAKNKPVEGAKVTIEASDGGRKFKLKTNKNGEYIQIGLPPGQYKITAAKDNLIDSLDQRIGLDMAEVNFTLKPGGARATCRTRTGRRPRPRAAISGASRRA